ncbi:MAG: TenA family protein [Deltaproteobacteria bacterium]|jgi:thiaminase/transcriptional activator TenA|nr:TenA family protein [Deltaproteobacteria bacterium]
MNWSKEAWQAIEPIFSNITDHPFVTSLIDGSLAKEKFLYYLNQDQLYLNDFSRVLAAIASISSTLEDTEAFLLFASQAVKVELELHRSYLGQMDPKAEQSPACQLYTSFLYKKLYQGRLEVAVATVLPCFWIYREVGNFILSRQTTPQNPYQSWIDTYGGEEYSAAVDKAIAICDRLADGAKLDIKNEMLLAFTMASKMEWMFWDSAWRLEKWPA